MKLLLKIYFLFPLLVFSISSSAQQPTVGLLHLDQNVSEGYTLFTPKSSQNVYLINNCGQKINEWTFSEGPGLTCYLLDNGNLLRAGTDSLEIRDWNNNLIWSYAMTNNSLLQHHDIEPLPNGNILCILTDRYTAGEMLTNGRDPSITSANFKLDKIVELQPIGINGVNIVWEWKFIDHLVQDFDINKLNYDIVANHPELIDINFDHGNYQDWTHVNAIDYNASLDQILISSRNLSEIFIIDHSTTTIEAAGHSGGNSNLGGDLLWRWGNPQVYREGTSLDQKLFVQHDSKWVESGYLDAGKISIFNNLGNNGMFTFSSIHLLTPDTLNGVYLKDTGKFKPLNFEWSWNGSILGNIVFESNKSGAHSLPNGNFIFCETSLGQVSEITKNGDHLWTYKNPVDVTIFNQFSTNNSEIFRAEKYPPNFIGFSGKNLSPQGIIENQNDISDTCNISSAIEESGIKNALIINPSTKGMIEFSETMTLRNLSIHDTAGKLVFSQEYFRGKKLQIQLKPAIYLIRFNNQNKIESKKIIVIDL